MTTLRTILSIYVLCAVLAITLGHIRRHDGFFNQDGSLHSQIRIRRQVETTEVDNEKENVVQEDEITERQEQEEDDVALENDEGEEAATETQDEDVAPENNEGEDTVTENQETDEVVSQENDEGEEAATETQGEDENVVSENEEENVVIENQEEDEDVASENEEDVTTEDQEEITEAAIEETTPVAYPLWTTCDFVYYKPVKSCYDCNSLLICKRVGGIVQPCNPSKPYCNNGFCSAMPSAQCASL